MSPSFHRLVADVGGTHARFASQFEPGAPLVETGRYACADFPSLQDALRHHLGARKLSMPAEAAIGIATAITGDAVRMTNNDWSFSIAQMKASLGLNRLLVINDFTALALALPALPREDLQAIGGGTAVAGGAMALIGAGTGLGVSGLLPSGGGYVPIAGEGGHVSLSTADAEEDAVLNVLRVRFGHVSAERVLSGPGIENLYKALAELRGQPAQAQGASQVTAAALDGSDALAVDALRLFSSLLGQAAGNLALTLGARGGVYLGGGIVPRLGSGFDAALFRERFEAKGRFQSYLAAIPTLLIRSSDEAALLGASRALEPLEAAAA
ncbi:MAG TPA: glucokinase [Burkholderiaceae bacterium]|jgi:glucokinase